MLIRKWDAARSEDEWRSFLGSHDFGQFIASGTNRTIPIVVPTHFVFDGESTILLHLARANPVWKALEENPVALMSVAGAYAYIPTAVNGGREEPAQYGVPTSYYAAVQASGPCEIVDGEGLAEILGVQLAHFQPEGGHAPVEPGDNPYAKQFQAIRGIRMAIEDILAKFKFGGNKTVEHRMNIAEWLSKQPGEQARQARQNLLRRLAESEGASQRTDSD